MAVIYSADKCLMLNIFEQNEFHLGCVEQEKHFKTSGLGRVVK